MKTLQYILFAVGLILISVFIFLKLVEPPMNLPSLLDKLQNEPISVLELEVDLEQVFTITDEDTYEEGKLTVLEADKSNSVYSIEVQPRGITRKEICDFPPLKLRFAKSELKENGMSTYRDLKLVTHCLEGAGFEQVLLKEFTAYKMYNVLTDKSFRVQLVRINYVDAGLKLPSSTHYGFLIENKKELADRIDAKLMGELRKPLTNIEPTQYRLFALFQYMIGNTDWNLSKQHNLNLLVAEDNYRPFPVPYDFDFSGLVDAPYAKPFHSLPIKDVKQRFFQYRGKRSVDFSHDYELFNSKKTEILGIPADFDLLQDSVKQEMNLYLTTFFDLIESPQIANDELLVGNAVAGQNL